ncbi:MAG: sensor histidine kinase [Microvirga sp.]
MPDERTGGTSVGPGPGETADRSGLRAVYYIAAAVLALLVPLILLAGIWIRQEFTKTQRDLEEYLEGRATALSQRVEAEIQQEITVLQAIAALPSLDEPNLPEFHREAARMIAAMPQWAVIRLVDGETGKEVANTLRPVGTDPADATAPDDVKAVAAARRPAVRTRLPEANGLFSDHAIFLYVPVIRDGGARYVLVAGARAATIQTILGEQADDPRVLTVVVDESDRILARSRAPDEFVTRQANPELRRSTAGRPGGLFAAPEVSSQDVFTAFRRSPTTGWLFVVATDRQQFDRLAQRSTLATIATASLALTLAVILAVFLFYNVMERRVSAERLAASRALSDLDARLLATTQEALAEQRKASSEREVLLREIYHRVKNNLQIVQSLLRLGSRDLGPDQRDAFESAIRRIGAMARVHTLLYSSADLASIDLREYLDGLSKEVADAFGAQERGIRTVVEADAMRVPLDTAVPLAFIAVEVLTNAFKHAFPAGRGGTIKVEARQSGDRGILVISDDGIGMKPESGARRALGLTIVSKLIQQIDGVLEKPEEGRSTVKIDFPLAGASSGPAEEAEERPRRAAAGS